jgi:hypothetical protein
MKSYRRISKSLVSILGVSLLLPLWQNCGNFKSSKAEVSHSKSEGNTHPVVVEPPPEEPPPDEPPPEEPPPVGKKVVAVGAGYGGRRAATDDGGESFYFDQQTIPGSYALLEFENDSKKKPICLHGSTRMPLGNQVGCCLTLDLCWAYQGHSTWLFRNIAYGNGTFLAVGGFTDGIVQASTDGKNWGPKLTFSEANHLLNSSVRTGVNWLAAAAYGNGKWMAVSGKGDIIYSTDTVHWSSRNPSNVVAGEAFRSLVFGGGYFVAGGSQWGISHDGETWEYYSASGGFQQILYFKNQFWAISNGQLYTLNISAHKWSAAGQVSGATRIFLSANGGLGASGSGKISFSPDGVKWSAHSININSNNITYIPGTGYIASDYSFANVVSTIHYSKDGINWTTRADRDPGDVQSISLWASGEVDL